MVNSQESILIKLPKSQEIIRYGNLSGTSVGYLVAKIIEKTSSPLLIICENNLAAEDIKQEANFFSPKTEKDIFTFNDWETLPYDSFSPHSDIVSERLLALHKLTTNTNYVCITAVQTVLNQVCPKEYVLQHTINYAVGDKKDLNSLRAQLISSGYNLVNEVMNHGEFAIRGSILDIYPMGLNSPLRIDFFGDEIDSIRTFDQDTQRTIDKIDTINILPAHEFPLYEEGIAYFRQNWRTLFTGDPLKCKLYNDVSNQIASQGLEYYLPLFFKQTATIFDYLKKDTTIVLIGDIENRINNFWQETQIRYEQFSHDIERPILKPENLFFKTEGFFKSCKNFSQIKIQSHAFTENNNTFNWEDKSLPDLEIKSRLNEPLQKLKEFLNKNEQRILFCAESKGRLEILHNILAKAEIYPKYFANWDDFLCEKEKIGITKAEINTGIIFTKLNIAIIPESAILGGMPSKKTKRNKTQDPELIIKNLTELETGSAVVHSEHGVGRYIGLKLITTNNIEQEFLELEYADKAKLYVPVSSLHLISRYSGQEGNSLPLHKLGSGQWEKAKRKAQEQVKDVAAELLNIYARREAREGLSIPTPKDDYELFKAGFPFIETLDQEQAIKSVLTDLEAKKPMDRLVCGDVGFGKTEVAMRASFVVANNHKQVAILVPTTLLAEQHYQSFLDRFADWPITIASLSRFRSSKETSETLEKLKNGKIDIIIGTHKLLQEKVKFKDLGLVIIDEEHRFGVNHKEKLKQLRANVDILTLTATPIPRTLNMAMSKMREISIISTPPDKRLAIKTFVREYNKTTVREAMLREIMRGGQVFYLHNDIQTIENTKENLSNLIPEAKFAIAHGQMPEKQLERVMSDFIHQKFNVLICTTIIETGIDIPAANTIIIERADKFGLAQLHQLRGRVGRSNHQAYAYLFCPSKKVMSANAVKRLEAIEHTEELGAGFILASNDLEIRGAGEILGDGQSGHIHAVGFSLYMEMLEQAVSALKEGKELDLLNPVRLDAEIDLNLPALIPKDYLADVNQRLTFYKRIASAKNKDELDDLKVEMIDRFGIMPKACKNLFSLADMKLIANKIGIMKIVADSKSCQITFTAKPNVSSATIIDLIQTKPAIYKLEGANKLRCNLNLPDPDNRIEKIITFLDGLTMKKEAV